MNTLYSNLPLKTNVTNNAIQVYNTYFNQPIELETNEFSAMKGFFESRKFDKVSSESIAVIIMTQAKKDGYLPMRILDTLTGLDEVELSALVAELLNFNRLKTSLLGYALKFTPKQETQRNILA